MSKIDNNRMIVIGGNHQNTLGVIEALGQKGVAPYVIIMSDVDSSYVLASKYISKGYILDKEADIVETINDICSRTKDIVASIACSDDAAVLLDSNFERWPSNFNFPSTKTKGELRDWTDKEKMTELAAAVGLDIPKSWLSTGGEIPEDIIFPCVTKPITSVHNGKHGFSKCNNREELINYFSQQKTGTTIQLQQFVEKDFEFQLLGCSINGGETIVIPGRTHINTTTGFNNLVFLKYDKYESNFLEVVELSKEYVRKTGYSGLFSIEFMHGKDGKNYFLEMNFRNDGNGIAVTASGTNLPYIWYLSQTGGDYQTEIKSSVVRTTYMMPELSFFGSMLNGEVPFKEWRKDMKLTNCYLTYFKADSSPFRALWKKQRKSLLLSIGIAVSKKIHIYNLLRKLK